MDANRSRYGLLISALGAVLLAISMFLPWYGISITTAGASAIAQAGDQFAASFGNANLQGLVGGLHGTFAALAGHEFASATARQALSNISIVLIVLAALAMLDSLVPLARAGGGVPEGAGRALVPLGIVASLLVAYRMIVPPVPAGEFVSLSLREGAWLALLGSLMIGLGGMWPRAIPGVLPADEGGDMWASLSGWTPPA
jgi:hypothetical protein